MPGNGWSRGGGRWRPADRGSLREPARRLPRRTIWRPRAAFGHDADMRADMRVIHRAVACLAALLPLDGVRPCPVAAAAEPANAPAIPPREQPIRFKLVPAWRTIGITMPGTVVCLDDDDARALAEGREQAVTVVALDAGRTAVILDAAGRQQARHPLGLPGDAAVQLLRTATDSRRQRWWLGAARGSPRVFLFDEDWAVRAMYPPPGEEAREPVGGIQLADCDGDGSPDIIVGFAGGRGLEAVSIDGRPLWRARSIAPVHDVVLDAPWADGRRGLVCLGAGGRLTSVGPDGAAGADRLVGPRGMQRLFAGPVAPDAAWSIAGLSTGEAGNPEAVGIGPDLARSWSLALDGGPRHAGPIEAVAWANLLGTGRRQWLVAGADGSVTITWADGGVVGRYRHGAPLAGVGGYRSRDGGHVVITTADAVESLRIDDVALD